VLQRDLNTMHEHLQLLILDLLASHALTSHALTRLEPRCQASRLRPVLLAGNAPDGGKPVAQRNNEFDNLLINYDGAVSSHSTANGPAVSLLLWTSTVRHAVQRPCVFIALGKASDVHVIITFDNVAG
jgi:hypothetical protein